MALLGREWRVLLAVPALLSLVGLASVYPTAGRLRDREHLLLGSVREHLASGDVETAERELRRHSDQFPNSPRAAEAEYLLGRIHLARAVESNSVPKAEAAWQNLLNSARRGQDATPALVETANLFRELNRYPEACEKYRTLIEEFGRREANLDVVTCLTIQSVAEPAKATTLAAEADRRIQSYLETAQGADRVKALRVRSAMLWRRGKYEESAQVADQALREFPAEEPRFRLDRGRALARLRQADRALQDLELARKQAISGADRAEAEYFLAEVRLRALDRRGVPIAGELAEGRSPFAPYAQLLLGEYHREIGFQDPYAQIRSGLARIRRAQPGEIPAADFEGIFERLRDRGKAEEDPDRIRNLTGAMDELYRLHPDRLPYAWEAANLRTYHGQRLKRRAEELRRGDPAAAAEADRAATRFLLEAARSYDRIAENLAEGRDALKSAAQAYREAGLHVPASIRFRAHYDAAPKPNQDSLFEQGQSLMDAGLYESDRPGEPAALPVFAEYLRALPDGGRASEILIQRARILVRLGRSRDAADELEPLLRDPRFGRDPTSIYWQEGLFLRATALADAARRVDASTPEGADRRRRTNAEARRLFEEYVERYAVALSSSVSPPAEAIDAAFAVARIALESRAWSEASSWVEKTLAYAARIPPPQREAQEPRLRQARFLLGDVYYNEGRYEDALVAHEAAFRRHANSDERLGAFLGRIRALLRLGRKDEAKRAFEESRNAWSTAREQFDASMGGAGREFWPARLREVEEELNRG